MQLKTIFLTVCAAVNAASTSGPPSSQIAAATDSLDQVFIDYINNLDSLTPWYVQQTIDRLASTVNSTLAVYDTANDIPESDLDQFAKNVIKDSGVMLTSILSNPWHLAGPKGIQELETSLTKVIEYIPAHTATGAELDALLSQLKTMSKNMKPRSVSSPLVDSIKTHASSAESSINTMIDDVKKSGAPTGQSISAFVAELNREVGGLNQAVSSALGPFKLESADVSGHNMLGPVYGSIKNGAELIVNNTQGGVDPSTKANIKSLVASCNQAIEIGERNNIQNTSELEKAVQRLAGVTIARRPTYYGPLPSPK